MGYAGWASTEAGRIRRSGAAGPRTIVAIASAGLLVAANGIAEGAPAAETTLVTVDSNGTQADSGGASPSISADGRYVAFDSAASTLVTGDTNGALDVFVRDRQTGTTTRVSLGRNGQQTNGKCYDPAISADGRYVAFYSNASNLVPGDTNRLIDVFVRDRQAGTTTRVSVRSNGRQANDRSYEPSISADGRYVAFYSYASNLVRGDTNRRSDIFVHDRRTGTTSRVSVRSNGSQADGLNSGPSLSGDGRYVAFYSIASNLVRGDTNDKWDAFVHDRQTGKTTRVSVRSNGDQANGETLSAAISASGRYVAFHSRASNLVRDDTNNVIDEFVHDRRTGKTTRVSVDSNESQANGRSYTPSISRDGRYVTYYSHASNLVRGDTNDRWDVFLRDRQAGTTRRLSVSSNGDQSYRSSDWPSISANGKYVVFGSYGPNLVANDTNNNYDLFVRGPLH